MVKLLLGSALVALIAFPVHAILTPDQVTAKIYSVVKSTVIDQYPTVEADKISVEIQNSILPSNIPDLAFECQLDLKGKHVVGYTSIPVLYYDKDQQLIDRRTILIKTQAYAQYYQLKRTVPSKTRLKKSDVVKIYKSVDSMPKTAIMQLDAIIGKETAIRMTKGTVLTSRLVRNIPDIRLGQDINVIVESGDIELEYEGVALESGQIGEEVMVKGKYYQAPLKGVVVDSRTVKVSSLR